MRTYLLLFALFFAAGVYAQLTINNTTYSTTQLVTNVLIPSGSGTVVSNVNFRGCLNISNRYQAGYFTTATSTTTQMGFTGGVILSTGNTSDVPLTMGTNPGSVAQISRNYTSGTAGEIRSSNAASGRDADVAVLITPENYYNAAILEFDFVPVNSFVQFRYVFGSEEYDDASGSAFAINYNCSQYNDKFAFLLSGPGISGGQGYLNDAINIARLSNNSQVAINSVNNGNVGSSGGSPNASNCLAANPLWTNGSPTAEFNGFINGTNLNGNTKALSAFYSGLTPGQTYHIRLVISDAKDGAYDSVVYIEEASFNTEVLPLPVEFIGFNGKCTDKGVVLDWTTASERYNSHFILSKSMDGLSFSEFATVNSYGFSSTNQNYQSIDNEQSNGTIYYRLMQEDINGERTILETIVVKNNCNQNLNDIIVFYSSNNNSISIDLLEKKIGEIEISIINSIGQSVLINNKTVNKESKLDIDLGNHFSSGIYFVMLKMNGKLVSKKILIQ